MKAKQTNIIRLRDLVPPQAESVGCIYSTLIPAINK
jgi:hypothetical protein